MLIGKLLHMSSELSQELITHHGVCMCSVRVCVCVYVVVYVCVYFATWL